MNSTSSESESMVGDTVTKDGDSFSVVSCAQPQKQNSGSDEDEEQPARLIFAKNRLKMSLEMKLPMHLTRILFRKAM